MATQSLALAGLHLLVVEDEPDSRDLIVFVLENEGARVTAVGSAQEALLALEQSRFDIILCDLHLPDQDGCELLQQWREREAELGLKSILAMAVTGSLGEKDKQRAGTAGFSLHIPKPIDIEKLPQVIATVAKRHKSVTPPCTRNVLTGQSSIVRDTRSHRSDNLSARVEAVKFWSRPFGLISET